MIIKKTVFDVIVASMGFVYVHEELNERHADLLSTATASNSCRKKISGFRNGPWTELYNTR